MEFHILYRQRHKTNDPLASTKGSKIWVAQNRADKTDLVARKWSNKLFGKIILSFETYLSFNEFLFCTFIYWLMQNFVPMEIWKYIGHLFLEFQTTYHGQILLNINRPLVTTKLMYLWTYPYQALELAH